MSRLIDLDQTIFVPITDESQGGVKYEQQMTIAEFFDKFFEGYQPEIVDAIPMWWIIEKFLDVLNKDKELSNAVWLVRKAWQKEQEAHDT